MLIFLRRLVLVYCSLVPAIAGAEACNVVHGLQDIYVDLDRLHTNGGRIGTDEALDLVRAANGIHPDVAEAALQDTEIGSDARAVVAPLRTFRGAGQTRIGDVIYFSDMDRGTVARALARAFDSLSELDCPRPVAEASQQSNFWDPTVSGAEGGAGGYVRYGGGGLAFVAMIGLIAGLVWNRDRVNQANQRFVCSIKADVTGPVDGWAAGVIIDLSRGGVKVALPEEGDPVPGKAFALRFNGQDLKGTIRWGNPHVFGGQFETALSKAELDKLLEQSKSQRHAPRRKARDRTAA